jgi:hypothetical protein
VRRSKARRNRIILSIISLLIIVSMGLSLVVTTIPRRQVTPTPIPTLTPFPTRTPTPTPTPS